MYLTIAFAMGPRHSSSAASCVGEQLCKALFAKDGKKNQLKDVRGASQIATQERYTMERYRK